MGTVTVFECRRGKKEDLPEKEKLCTDGQRLFLHRRFNERGMDLAARNELVLKVTLKSDWKHLTRGEVTQIVEAIDKAKPAESSS